MPETKWMYCRIVNWKKGGMVRQLNELGGEGWELVSVAGSVAYLKKMVPPQETDRVEPPNE